MLNLINKLIYWIYRQSKSYCIKKDLLNSEVVDLKVDYEYPTHDNNLNSIKRHSRNMITHQFRSSIDNFIEFTDNSDDIDNNFILRTTGRLKIIKLKR